MKTLPNETMEIHLQSEPKRPETSRTLMDKLKHYTFPSCTQPFPPLNDSKNLTNSPKNFKDF